MSDENQAENAVEETTAKTAETQTNDIVNVNSDLEDIDSIVEMASGMKISGEELITNYYDWTPGDVIRVLPLDVKRIQKMNPSRDDWENKKEDEDNPMTNAIRFLCIDDKFFYISADAVVVSSMMDAALYNKDIRENRSAKPLKFYQLTCTGTKDSKKGTYKTFSARQLI